MKKKLERNIKIDYVSRFLANFDFSGAIWVLYLAYKGMNLWQIGILEGIFHVVSFLSEVPSGAAADLWGRKKVMIYGRVCSVLASVIMLFSSEFWQFAVSFVFMAWGYNLVSGSEEALVYDSLKQVGKEERFYRVNSRLEVIIEVAQGLGTFVGGILAEISYVWCYGAAIFIGSVSLIPCLMLTEPEFPKKEKQRLDMHFRESFRTIKENPKVTEILLFYSLIFTFYAGIYYYGQQYFYEMNLNKIEISVIMLFVGVFSCMGALVSEKLVKKYGEKVKYGAAWVIGFCVLGMVPDQMWLAVFCFCIMGFANSMLYPMQSASLNALIPSEQRATIISVSSMIYSMFMILLFPMIGAFAERFGLHQTFGGVGGMIAAVLLIMVFFKKAASE